MNFDVSKVMCVREALCAECEGYVADSICDLESWVTEDNQDHKGVVTPNYLFEGPDAVPGSVRYGYNHPFMAVRGGIYERYGSSTWRYFYPAGRVPVPAEGGLRVWNPLNVRAVWGPDMYTGEEGYVADGVTDLRERFLSGSKSVRVSYASGDCPFEDPSGTVWQYFYPAGYISGGGKDKEPVPEEPAGTAVILDKRECISLEIYKEYLRMVPLVSGMPETLKGLAARAVTCAEALISGLEEHK